MKAISNHLGQVIAAIAAVALLITSIALFKAPVSDFFNSIVDKETSVGDTIMGSFDAVDESLGHIPTFSELESRYEFSYYSSITGAFDDLNNDTIGTNADSTKETAKAGIYTTKDGTPSIVLLQDDVSTSTIYVGKDVILNLNGNVLTFESVSTAAMNLGATPSKQMSNTSTYIDGRLQGSAIKSTNNTRLLQAASGNLEVNGGTYEITTNSTNSSAGVVVFTNTGVDTVLSNCNISSISTNSNAKPNVIYSTGSSDLIINNCNITGETTNTVYGVYVKQNGNVVINSCNVSVDSSTGNSYGVYDSSSGGNSFEITDSYIFADSQSGDAVLGNCSVGICQSSSTSTLTLNDSYVYGNHSGVCTNGGNIYVNGGTYEGVDHGGFYLGHTASNEAYINGAEISAVHYKGTHSGFSEQYFAGFYVGGSSATSNIKVYMNDCDISGGQTAFVLRGTEGEKHNSVYISNSSIGNNTIRIDNDTHKLYIGSGCNFTAEDTSFPASVIITDEVYKK